MQMKKSKRSLVIVGVLVVLVLLAGTVIVFAQGTEKRNESGRIGIHAPGSQGRANQMRPPEGFNKGWRRAANIDYDALLAEALDITTDELSDARREANLAALEQAVEEGVITQRRADLIVAVPVLRGVVDRAELVAGALGVSVEELQEARQDRALPALLEELEMTRVEVREAVLVEFEEFIQQAVNDELISEEQAELILESPGLILKTQQDLQARGRFQGRGNNRGMRGGRGPTTGSAAPFRGGNRPIASSGA
jgi:hypothetical protein